MLKQTSICFATKLLNIFVVAVIIMLFLTFGILIFNFDLRQTVLTLNKH